MKQNVTVLIPAFNEGKNIRDTLVGLKGVKEVNQILVIDDGSTDNTCQIVEAFSEVTLLKQGKNLGKGAALKRGILEALDKADIIVFLDADTKNTSNEIKKLITPIINEITDVAIAKFPPPKIKGGFGFVKSLAETGVYFHTGKTLTTSLSGQRAFHRDVLKNIAIDSKGFGVEIAMTIDILKKGYRVLEVEVAMSHRETDRSVEGFIHRGKQFIEVFKVIYLKKLQRMN
ncbi:glycosyltransferase family 2 protein [Alkaliphilus pronyensis]|uniref:Glycosyltransferase family 2 protein n=1 Tax=Alkaliphilus pronyensis TaxID=1482732 RepID=A0A6I0F4G3_9FIRM|nr:glycosyltransferase family 2 protein [Alkaliphilus pronyensis]KAB3537400.1 glycosyltransferase family 2 protein [Alkaliphilus pronyensis]